MAQTRERPASRGRSGGTKTSKRSSANGSRSSAQTKSRARKSGGSRAKAPTSSSSNGARRSSSSGNGVLDTVKGAAVPVATGVVGVVGGAVAGVVLGRRNRKPRKVLGVPIPGSRDGLSGLAKEVRKAGQQFGNLANEVQTTRKKAEDVGKAIS
jgi:hypothetical protein